ncbi:MAG: toprim domain-containing protein [Candidatus Nealsonbacteria bacterium]|nr:toprim domain-containing protein [Candidatus Nealsonbacteria bacterium]
MAAKFYERQLEASKAGLEAKSYLLSRGLSELSIKDWRIGYAPDSWHGLGNFLNSSSYQSGEIEKAGLAVRSESGSVHDRFRGRIMFPIFDFNSQVVGFGGRITQAKSPDDAKYINTPGTILYDKSRILYGLDRAKVEIKKKNACILVEGYTDVIMSVQSGILNVVSSSGTALTLFQLKIMKRYTENLILGYDMDLAGDTANKRGIDLALSEGFSVRVVRPPYEGKDPADVIAENPEEWKKAVLNTKSIMEYYFENALAGNDTSTPEGKKNISKLLLPAIKKLDNQVEQSYWLKILAHELDAREEDLRQELKKVKDVMIDTDLDPVPQKTAQKTRIELLEERLLVLILKYANNIETVDIGCLVLFSEQAKGIFFALKESPIDLDGRLPPEIKGYYDVLYLKAEIETVEEKEAAEETLFLINEVKNLKLKAELEVISKKLRKAEQDNNAEAAESLKKDYNALSKSIFNLEHSDKV